MRISYSGVWRRWQTSKLFRILRAGASKNCNEENVDSLNIVLDREENKNELRFAIEVDFKNSADIEEYFEKKYEGAIPDWKKNKRV